MEIKAVITIILAIVSIGIIVISLLMAPDSNAFSGALVGSGDLELFKTSKERGFKKVLKWLMISSGLLLMVLTIICWALVK
ncbi:preprotein translocase subunit SecG [Mycoplasmopsis primatum]|uniref:preprotein translocase subunit SecG n=1 Tax=Mycoplasmopsis primatum TaxID=55604 RepID=UPI0004959106|nr:preprotein translocase subunit SecG [Mycoplasmopsis primatum]